MIASRRSSLLDIANALGTLSNPLPGSTIRNPLRHWAPAVRTNPSLLQTHPGAGFADPLSCASAQPALAAGPCVRAASRIHRAAAPTDAGTFLQP